MQRITLRWRLTQELGLYNQHTNNVHKLCMCTCSPQVEDLVNVQKGAIINMLVGFYKIVQNDTVHMQAVCFVFERARATRHFLFGKGQPMRKL